MTNLPHHGSTKRHHEVLLDDSDYLFEWLGAAASESEAVEYTRSSYGMALEAILKAQGLSVQNVPEALSELDAYHLPSPMKSCWRVSFRIFMRHADSEGAAPNYLTGELMATLLRDAALSDADCFQAVMSGTPVWVGISVVQSEDTDNYEIDAFPLFGEARTMRRRIFKNPVLHDALRIVILRSFDMFTVAPDPATGESTLEFPLPVEVPQSATLHAKMRLDGPRLPQRLIEWLHRDGFLSLAQRLAASFEMGLAR